MVKQVSGQPVAT